MKCWLSECRFLPTICDFFCASRPASWKDSAGVCWSIVEAADGPSYLQTGIGLQGCFHSIMSMLKTANGPCFSQPYTWEAGQSRSQWCTSHRWPWWDCLENKTGFDDNEIVRFWWHSVVSHCNYANEICRFYL